MTRAGFEVKPFPRERHDVVDALEVGNPDRGDERRPAVCFSQWGRIEPREYLALTASVDHDVVDGAPAARFARRLRELIESAEVLQGISERT
jgi:hypothetical protein